MEENKNKSKKWIIPLVISIVIFIIGITILIIGITTNVPSMGFPGWFENQTSRSACLSFGGFITIASIIGGISTTIAVYKTCDPNYRENTLNKLNNFKEKIKQSFGEDFVELMSDIKDVKNDKSEIFHCEYCGGILTSEDKSCPSCGARATKKNKNGK